MANIEAQINNSEALEILTNDGLSVLVGEIKGYLQNKITESKDSVLEYTSSLYFPTTGKKNTVYIDKQKNKSYRWDDDNVKYYVIGSDYNDIELIDANF